MARWQTTLLVLVPFSPALADEQGHSRGRASSNAEYGIVMRAEAPGKCRVEVTRDAEVAWTLPHCVGTVDDLYFVSDSGERFWVLASLPKSLLPPASAAQPAVTKKSSARKKAPPFDAYGPVVVAWLYDRLGNLVGERHLAELLPTSGHRKLRTLDRRFVWLEGVLGVPGREPRANEQNQVEFETVEPKTWRLEYGE